MRQGKDYKGGSDTALADLSRVDLLPHSSNWDLGFAGSTTHTRTQHGNNHNLTSDAAEYIRDPTSTSASGHHLVSVVLSRQHSIEARFAAHPSSPSRAAAAHPLTRPSRPTIVSLIGTTC